MARITAAGLLYPEKAAVEVAFLTGEKAGPGREAERSVGWWYRCEWEKAQTAGKKGAPPPHTPFALLGSRQNCPSLIFRSDTFTTLTKPR